MLLVWLPIAFLTGVLQASFVEWAFHRYWLHRPWLPESAFTFHTLVHHQLCKFDDTFQVHEEEQEEALTFGWLGGPILVVLNTLPWALLAWALWALGVQFPFVAFVGTIAATILVYYIGYEGLHYLMHKPSIPFIERGRYFRFIEKHHRIHHVHMDRNLNVLLPIADFVLGTLVTKMPEARETPEAARKLARRHSNFGRRMGSDGA